MMRLSPIRCSTNLISHSWLTVSKNDWMSASSMKFTFLLVIPTQRGVERVVRSPPRTEPVREPEEVFLVDRVEHRDRRPLDDLVLQRGNRERTLFSISLQYVPAA